MWRTALCALDRDVLLMKHQGLSNITQPRFRLVRHHIFVFHHPEDPVPEGEINGRETQYTTASASALIQSSKGEK